MAFWEIFKKQAEESNQSELFYELKKELPDLEESELIKIACVSGLMARVAYVDFKLDASELAHIGEVLKEWTDFDQQTIDKISQLAVRHIKELAGLENHLYVYPLRDVLDRDSRFKIVEALFALAAADGSVENIESEEIRMISKGLELSDKHFMVARGKVAKHIAALR